MTRVLVVAPHPDDEAIGCGGTLLLHRRQGAELKAVFLTSGEAGGHGRPPDVTASRREAEAARAADLLDIGEIEFWRQPDGGLRITKQTTGRLCRLLRSWKPEIVYVTHPGEMHPDHRAAASLVRRAVSTVRNKLSVRGYEVWTPLGHMDHVVDISDVVSGKRAAIRAYRSQCSVLRFDTATLALNRYRGEMHSWPGGPFAEVFSELR